MDFDSIVLTIIAGLSVFGLVRVLDGPTVWDRMLGFSLFSSKVIVAAVFIGIIINRTYMIDVALIYGVLGFIGTIMIARFIERKGDV
ncbi:monovalent cation/H+ antiporter complex subunit F [Alkalibacterium olivapovliticus]|uniref:Multicomponent Na+:H+ antiporter subunit F n=1 Tax=Alkalibacterium olivapovliticus TaxID=99907 RepID=A0A2T0W9F9_9LACT|nr:monovalent cation/H+ antiporter complex subunit F [Alkalibacterium olivapovliticus]PRY83323.1 multicomponent Na+:H+ antiporter subunit F [Alkalibacterium olivapovliticus]